MKIVRIVSEHKSKLKNKPLKKGYKRVEAIVDIDGFLVTKHIDIKKDEEA